VRLVEHRHLAAAASRRSGASLRGPANQNFPDHERGYADGPGEICEGGDPKAEGQAHQSSAPSVVACPQFICDLTLHLLERGIGEIAAALVFFGRGGNQPSGMRALPASL
jgi:hypothetical protein